MKWGQGEQTESVYEWITGAGGNVQSEHMEMRRERRGKEVKQTRRRDDKSQEQVPTLFWKIKTK